MTTKAIHRRLNTTLSLIEFLRPGGYWPQPYSLEMAFQVFRCLLASGVGFKTHRPWVTTSVTSLLGGYSPDHSYPRPIKSIADLRARFQDAILARGESEVQEWRAEKGISAYAELPGTFYHYKPFAAQPQLGFESENAIHKALTGLLEGSGGKELAISLNSIHYGARIAHGVDITVSPSGFCVTLRYGFHTPEDMLKGGDSEWNFTLASSKPDAVKPEHPEPFLDTLRRALDRFAEIVDPANSHLTTTLNDRSFVPRDMSKNRALVLLDQETDPQRA